MSHFAPHTGVSFEGYYSKFRLSSGSSIALIVSAVPAAANNVDPEEARKRKAFMISFTYVQEDSKRWYQKEYWPATFDIDRKPDGQGFRIKWDQGEFGWAGHGEKVWWELNTDEMRFSSETRTGSRAEWIKGDPTSTPAGSLARLPLPIQWDVHSLDSDCQYSLDLHDENIFDKSDKQGKGHVHTEKNWAYSFPDSYIWIQARDHERGHGVCLAGGSLIPGVQAFLVGYDHPQNPLSFRPPDSTSIFGLSLGLTSNISYQSRRVIIDIRGWFSRIQITAQAEADTFFTFAAPLHTGHTPDYATQSFGAHIHLKTWERSWPWSRWREVTDERFERGSLEFGGGFYKSHSE